MFTKTLDEKLGDFGYDEATIEGNKLTHSNTEDEESKVTLEVETEENDSVVKATIKHPDGEWKATFHTDESQDDNLAETIVTEYQYWCEN